MHAASSSLLLQSSHGQPLPVLSFQEEEDPHHLHRLDKQAAVSSLLASRALPDALRLHSRIACTGLDLDLFVSNHLINQYSRLDALQNALSVFHAMPQRNLVSWNAVIAACSQHGHHQEALDLFWQMQRQGFLPNRVTFLSLLRIFEESADIEQGWLIHHCVCLCGLESEVTIMNSVVNMYGQCGAVHDAWDVFDSMPEHDVVSWTTIIMVLSEHGCCEKAIELNKEMQDRGIEPDKVAFVGIIGAFANMIALEEGRSVHEHVNACGLDGDVYIQNALINLYGRCGDLESACLLLCKSHQRTFVTWNAMITVFSLQERSKECLDFFLQMREEGIKPTFITFTSLLGACACPTALGEGRTVHFYVVENEFESNYAVQSALVSMYGKCGALEEARFVFDDIHNPNSYTWNAMIAAYSQHGRGEDVLELFQAMAEKDVQPNQVTYVSLLSACSHAGLLDEGCGLLMSMLDRHSMFPLLEHYSCIIDSLCRAGKLDEAENVINNMPFEPDVRTLTSLLRACKLHSDIVRGERAAKYIFTLDPHNTAALMILSSMYSVDGRSDAIGQLSSMLEEGDKDVLLLDGD